MIDDVLVDVARVGRCRAHPGAHRPLLAKVQHNESARAVTAAENVLLPLVRPLATVAMLVAAYVFTGWLLHREILITVVPGDATMKVNSSVACFLAGLSLWLLADDEPTRLRRSVRELCALIVSLIGLLTLAEYITGLSLGIDELLIRDFIGRAKYPGRFAPNTAALYTLFGIAL